MIKRLGAILLGLNASQAALATDVPAWLTERRIIGHNDLEPIEAVVDTDAYERTRIVARVEEKDGTGFCTASRVADNLFLTNYHCFEYKPCAELKFHLGFEKRLARKDQIIYRCTEVLSKNEAYDYALYRVELVGPLADGDTKTHDFLGLDLAIPDNDRAGVEKSFDIAQDGKILDMKVHLKVTHPWVGDLRISLVSPQGTEVVLQDSAGGDGRNLDKTYAFTDGLSAFKDQPATGAWRLKLKDVAASDSGQLDSVSFEFTTAVGEDTPEDLDAARELAHTYPTARLWGGDIRVGQQLVVASHPRAREKEIDRSNDCKLRTIQTEQVSGRTTITHMCDTEGGSSGSPLIDRDTGAVVALHWGGTDEYNLAIPMSLVLKHIEQNVSAEVYGELSIER